MAPTEGDPDVQLIFIYCGGQQQQEEVVACCRTCRRPQRQPEILTENFGQRFAERVRGSFPDLPDSYEASEKADFYAEAGVLLAASVLAASRESTLRSRWPALLVTDRERLCAISSLSHLRRPLSEAGRLKENDLLTVVLASDFGTLCGVLATGAPLESCGSLALPQAETAPSEVPVAGKVELKLGVYLQKRPTWRSDGSPGDEVRLFGSRCWALLPGGRGAYSAISPDGVRTVEAYGRWEVLNGQVVLLPSPGASAAGTVAHLRLWSQDCAVLSAVGYEEPPYIDLEELIADFEPARSLGDCQPRGGRRLWLKLQEEVAAAGTAGLRPVLLRAGPERSKVQVLVDALDSTVITEQAKPSSAGQSSPGSPHRLVDGAKSSHEGTAAHALLSLAAGPVRLASDADMEAPVPRLLGFQRGVTQSKVWDASGRSWSNSLVQAWEQSNLEAQLPSVMGTAREALNVTTGILKPGTYRYEDGQGSAPFGQRRLELVLHVDGRCDYKDEVYGSVLVARQGATAWRLEDNRLVLYSHRPGDSGRSFLLRENRVPGRTFERRVGRVELLIRDVLRFCSFEPWNQLLVPFPEHNPIEASQRIFGLVDPASPSLQGLRGRAERLPFHAFEFELRSRGLPCDEIISDFQFVDRDEDGEISVAELRRVETYGFSVAPPEVLSGLREGLVKRFGNLSAAFEAMLLASDQAEGGQITGVAFESFLQKQAAHEGHDGLLLRTWVVNTSAEDRSAVFATLNPNRGPGVDLSDLLCLSLHSAVLTVRRMQHFQSWIFERFGQAPEVFRQVFEALSAKPEGLSRKAFLEGVQALGFPYDAGSIRSIFSLLDRSFQGLVSLRDFQKLREFSGEELLLSLEALKRLVDERFGGVEAGFRKFLEKERAIQGLSSLPKTASFDAFQKVCGGLLTGAGVPKDAAKQSDLRLLFLFFSEAAGRQANGFLTLGEWQLLKGFNSKAFTGSPARLRRILEEQFGDMDTAFQRMHTAWLQGALSKGLRQATLAGLARCLLAQDRDGQTQTRHRLGRGGRSGHLRSRPHSVTPHLAPLLLPPPLPHKRLQGSSSVVRSPQRPCSASAPSSPMAAPRHLLPCLKSRS